MAKKKPAPDTPDNVTPSTDVVPGEPLDVWDMVNKYGRCEVQDTTDTDNIFPLIGPLGAGCVGIPFPDDPVDDDDSPHPTRD